MISINGGATISPNPSAGSFAWESARALASCVDCIADRHLADVGLPASGCIQESLLPWLDDMIFVIRADNFFERLVTSYKQADVTERKLPWLEPDIPFDKAS